jgi:hypothetical protein
VLLLGWQVDLLSALLAALLVPAVLEIAMLPISIGGWGVREGAAIVAFASVGVSPAVAFGGSVAFALLSLLLALVGGTTWLLGRRPGMPNGDPLATSKSPENSHQERSKRKLPA